MTAHKYPVLQKGISQSFRAQQSSTGNGVALAVAKLWNAGFSIKEARDSWETMRPALVMLVNRYYNASQLAGKTYYNACRIAAGLDALPASVKVPPVILDAHHLGRVIDPCGLGAFLHQVKQGDMMMDAFTSARTTLMAAVATLIMSGARDWIQAASDADPKSHGVRRVTAGTCGYCEHLAEMGAKVPPGGWHADCDCTNEPTFGTDTGPSPSLPSHNVEGSIGIQEKTWNDTVKYVGNSLKSGNLKDAQEFLNPDGSLNESKAITHLLHQHKNYEPYSLSASGKPLNKTQTNLLDKFFGKLVGLKKTKGKIKAKPITVNGVEADVKSDVDALAEKYNKAMAEAEADLSNASAELDHALMTGDKSLIDMAKFHAKKATEKYDQASDSLDELTKAKPSAADMVDEFLDKEDKPGVTFAEDALKDAHKEYADAQKEYEKGLINSEELMKVGSKLLDAKGKLKDAKAAPKAKSVDDLYQEMLHAKKFGTDEEYSKTKKAYDAAKAYEDSLHPPAEEPSIEALQEALDKAETDLLAAHAKKKENPEAWLNAKVAHEVASNDLKDALAKKSSGDVVDEEIKAAQAKLTAAEKDLIAKENIKINIPFWDKATNSGAPYDKAVKDWEDAKNAHFQAAQHLQFLKEQADKANPAPSAEHTPLTKAELKALDDGIKEWKTSNAIARQKIQQEIIKALAKPGSGSNARIRAIARALQEQSEDAPQLYRGLSWNIDDPYDKPQWDAMKAILDQGPGARFDLPPSSFSEGEEWPTKFMAMKDTAVNSRKMKIILQDGAKGINIEDLGVKQGEMEWLTGGKFELVSMGKHGNSFNIVIKQVAGLDKPVTLKQPESKAFISAVTSWKGSSVTLSKQIDTILKGNPGTGPAQVIVDYLRTNTENAPPLYRGLKFYQYTAEKNAAALAFEKANEPGKDIYLPAASFSTAKSVGTSFAGGAHAESTVTKFMYELVGGKGVDIVKTGGTMLHEKEWITGGIFHIKSRSMIDGIMHIYVDQVATLVE